MHENRRTTDSDSVVADSPIVVAALYRFVRLPDHESLRPRLEQLLAESAVRGSLLLAAEGINGTIAGSREGIDTVLAELRSIPEFAELDVKESRCAKQPFRRMRVRLKREIVTMGVDGIDPNQSAGTYVDPEQWNDLISDPDVLLIDTRNDYEISIGTFEGATNPGTESFRQFPEYVQQHLDPERHKKVAMFCTGGIRCEKSTALLKQQGFQEVYHLRGGILKYLETIPESQSMWNGDCFVFDQRVSVGHGLTEGGHVMCYACGWPVSEQDQRHPDYEPGVHCPKCKDQISQEQRERFAQRQAMWEKQGRDRPMRPRDESD
ncbi:rhodanese-related sulfurtransferase [Roseiconus nitratireducens]|uniref:tRNA uridine(34) hydroxylase n=1 Tax=Roseiconus nitratireducens TaxID=2605748 RepID=A0A5M6DFR8_9BACT|nr:rhodanese-related sulfurtransferase [Roseiconus nitratireducens]KAA5545246.1 rhodanese-related sulfurtransferase [Roseiconus nitratireducens]